jgi:hypothetical protein
VYVVAGDSVGTGTAKYGTFPLSNGVAYGVGSGDGAEVGLPNATGPTGDRTSTIPLKAPDKITTPKFTGTFVAFGMG